MAIWDQFVCGLKEPKFQRELLCETELTAIKALQRAQAMETVEKESGNMRVGQSDLPPVDGDTNIVSYGPCYRCGNKGHSASVCRFKTAKCHTCQKTGHLARVCRSKQKTEPNKYKLPSTGKAEVHQLQDKDKEENDESDDGEQFNICQLSNPANKFIVKVLINRVEVDMEVDSGVQRSTVMWKLFQEQLNTICHLMPTSVTL